VDCTAPAISAVAANVNLITASVTFATDEGACGKLHYGTDCAALTMVATGTCGVTSHNIVLPNLQGSTTYYFTVEAIDTAGNAATSDNGGNCFSFTTPPLPDDYFTQFFTTGSDLANLSVTFTPDGSNSYYKACSEYVTSLPTDPSGGTALDLSDDSFATISPTGRPFHYTG